MNECLISTYARCKCTETQPCHYWSFFLIELIYCLLYHKNKIALENKWEKCYPDYWIVNFKVIGRLEFRKELQLLHRHSIKHKYNGNSRQHSINDTHSCHSTLNILEISSHTHTNSSSFGHSHQLHWHRANIFNKLFNTDGQ